ncbi:MAG: pyruvate carboxylase [Deltaproteobacteria bacterium]|nr:pyruvate carboxylase [Deltaproteobacteria bacterium]
MPPSLRKLERILVANRGEIAIRVLRAAAELNIRTVALYTYEDRYSLHRYKADEAYRIGSESEALKPYLDIEEIIRLAKRRTIDAIHPGYGFLSENSRFAERCREEGIIFIGPDPEIIDRVGDKIKAKKVAREVNVPVIEDSRVDLTDAAVALKEAQRIGFPVVVKAAAGGGGRGMRIIRDASMAEQAFAEAQSEALRAFGDGTVYLEKYLEEPRHVEVQIMGDRHGNIVHLFERDCSVQRRFQKVVEVAPCPALGVAARQALFQHGLALARHVGYNNVGTVEFLIDKNEDVYFIEINPRIQVEHTVTEQVTGIDIVRSQILIAQGYSLSDPEINISNQDSVTCQGYAIQCRITTEDPQNEFKPDYGKLIAYRSPGGFGIRLDAGSAYSGASISPFFDSLLVKVTASGRTLDGAARRLQRALREFRIRGVRTNIAFLENVITHPQFLNGKTTTGFIAQNPELLEFSRGQDRATKALRYLADITVNGNPDVSKVDATKVFRAPVVPPFSRASLHPPGSKQLLAKLGREKFCAWLKNSKSIQYTDTTFRDAHQSLLATRVRTYDLMAVAESFARTHPEIFSMEVWGGATFDVSLRFLHECPWRRLAQIREAVPNILLQMLLRGANAVGYSAYSDNLVASFIEESWKCGVDIFRIFDSLNWLEGMRESIRAVRERTEGLAEVCICYSGDILDPKRQKYSLAYYLDLARQIEDAGAHILAIKDMAGLLKPYAAEKLISELRKAINLPIHLHTHDTSSIQAATYLKAVEAGVNVIDVALGSMSGLTSQPNFESIACMLKGHERELPLDIPSLSSYSNYWEAVREVYYPFESELKAGSAEVYRHEIPGGQYSNLRPQARALGLESKFEVMKENYVVVNELLGDVVKVTPSSKMVGDLALYMTSNDLTSEDLLSGRSDISFPESVRGYFRGDLGQPYGGFPEKLQAIILKGEKPLTGRPNESLPALDIKKDFEKFLSEFSEECDFRDYLSFKMYPKVFREYFEHRKTFGSVEKIPTAAFFFGLRPNEEILVDIAEGKTLIIKMQHIGEIDEAGQRPVFFKLNGQSRTIDVRDKTYISTKRTNKKVSGPQDVGSPLQGKVSKVLVREGAAVKEGAALFLIEAMKMETTVNAPRSATVSKVILGEGTLVEQDDVVLELQ